MRKLILLLLCTATLGLASCKKETIVDAGLPNQTIETVINPNDWQSVENGTRLTRTLNFPEIDKVTFDNDGVLAYIYPNNAVAEYKQIPHVFDAQSYTYSVRQGSITVDIQTSGDTKLTPMRPTTPVGLRIVLITSRLN